MTPSDWVTIVSGVVSTVLGVIAIALSLYFASEAKKDAYRSEAGANEVSAGVKSLEKIFDSLYSGIFSMMNDTVTDLRKHVWHAPQTTAITEPARNDDVEQGTSTGADLILEEISAISKKLGIAETKIAQLQIQIQPAIEQGLRGSTPAETNPSAKSVPQVKESVLEYVRFSRQNGLDVTPRDIAMAIKRPMMEVVSALFELGQDGQVRWSGSPSVLGDDDLIEVGVRGLREGLEETA